MQGGDPCPCWLSTAVDSRCYLLITDISKVSYGLTDSVTDPLPTLFYLIMEHMVAVWCSTILNIFFNVFLHWIPQSLFLLLLDGSEHVLSFIFLFSSIQLPCILQYSTTAQSYWCILSANSLFFSPLKNINQMVSKNDNYI